MPIHTLQTIPQEPEETSLSGLAIESGELPALALRFCLLSLTFCLVLGLGPAGILVAAVIILLRRYRNATHIWCAEWYKAIRDRESCVRTYAHARPGTPAPCRR
jgi:hypothetical protein